MGMLKEFRDFTSRGNVIDLAVGVVIGAAFNPIVNSFVNDILMPPLGMVLSKVDFKDIKIVLVDAIMEGTTIKKPAVSINIGVFINYIISFLITAFAVFLIVKFVNAMRKKDDAAPTAPAAPPTPSDEVVLLTEIRDSLRNR